MYYPLALYIMVVLNLNLLQSQSVRVYILAETRTVFTIKNRLDLYRHHLNHIV